MPVAFFDITFWLWLAQQGQNISFHIRALSTEVPLCETKVEAGESASISDPAPPNLGKRLQGQAKAGKGSVYRWRGEQQWVNVAGCCTPVAKNVAP